MKAKTLEEILLWIGDVTEHPVREVGQKMDNRTYLFHGKMSDYDIIKTLDDSLKCYKAGEFDAACVRANHCLNYILENISMPKTCDKLEENLSLLQTLLQYKRTLEKEIENQALRQKIFMSNFQFIKEPGVLSAWDAYRIKEGIKSHCMKLLQYRKGMVIDDAMDFRIHPYIIAADDVDSLIHKSSYNDVWEITVGLYIEKKIDLSYFIITFSKGGNIYLLSDRPTYTNPDQIDRLHGGGRRFSQDREGVLDFLPYILIDRVIENREKNTSLANSAGREVWTFPLTDYFGDSIIYVIQEVLSEIIAGETIEPTYMMGQDVKLIGSKQVDINDESVFRQDKNTAELRRIIDELYGSECTSLAVQEKELLPTISSSLSLLTRSEVDRFVKYEAHKRIVEQHNREKFKNVADITSMHELYDEYLSGEKELQRMFLEKKEHLERYMFAGDTVYLHDIDHPVLFGGFCSENYPRWKRDFVKSVIAKDEGFRMYDSCSICGVKGYSYQKMEFMRYTEILALLGIRRNDLPNVFRDYLASQYIPYEGNSILDNVLPEYSALTSDIVLRNNPNGLRIQFAYCKKCMNALYKQHKVADIALITISSKENRVISVEPFNEPIL